MCTAKGDGYTATPRDLELVVNAINCTRLPFEIDYDKLSRKLGYKNAQSAEAAWNALKKKLDKVAEGAPVVPSLTIEPEPLRKTTGSPITDKPLSRKAQKGKQHVVEASSETSEDESGEESDVPPVAKPSKKRTQVGVVDDDGDLVMAMAEERRISKTGKLSPKAKDPRVDSSSRHHRRPTVPSSTSVLVSDTDVPAESKTPRKKLKRKFTHLSVSDRAQGKSARELENEAYAARQKAYEAFGMRGDEDDEDDEEPVVEPPPPPYVKRESESGGSVR